MYKRKDGLWADSVSVPGKKSPKYFYGKTQAEVKKKIAAWNAEQEKGLTVRVAVEEWEKVKEKEVTYKTIEGYKAPIKRINDAFGDQQLADLEPAQIQAFIKGIAAKGYKRGTVQRPLDVLRMVYDYYITKPGSGIKYNPCTAVRLPSGLEQEARDLASREDVEIVKNSLHLPFGLFPYFIMYSGLRDGEVLAIRYEDISDNKIRVTKSVSWQTNKPVIKKPKTEKGIRDVPLLSPLKAALPKQWSGYLFSADGGKTPLTHTQFRNRWNGYCRASGLADCVIEEQESKGLNKRIYYKKNWKNRIVPYQLRHEFATLCFDAELDPKDVQELMGHANEETARRIYTHIQESRRAKTVEKLEKYVEQTVVAAESTENK